MPYQFFTSYAHADALDDDLLRTFYFDLASELKRTTAAREDEFLDVLNIASGEEWRRSLADALGSSKSLLAFYSPLYFGSPDCGKEVAAFQTRLRNLKNDVQNPAASTASQLFIGVLWESERNFKDRIPLSLTDFQYGVPHFAEEPLKSDRKAIDKTVEVQKLERQYGLRRIMQLKDAGLPEYTAAYLEIVSRYAAHVEVATRQCDLSAYGFTGDYRTLTPTFPVQLSVADAAASTRSSGRKGPKYVRVLFIVGAPATFAGMNQRSNVTGYSDDPRLWQPFLPEADDEIGPIVGRAIALEKMNPEFVSTSAGLNPATLSKIVDAAENDNNILVVIIDPWSVYIPSLASNLISLDKRRIVYGSMFVCWNEKDSDITTRARELLDELEGVFFGMTQENASLLSEIVFHSPQELENHLRAKVTLAKTRILARLAKQGHIRPLPPGTPLPSTSVPVK